MSNQYYYGAPPPTYPPTANMQESQQSLIGGPKVVVVQQQQQSYGNQQPQSSVRIVTNPRFQDLWAAILFLVFFAAFIVLAVIGIPKAITDLKDGTIGATNSNGTRNTKISISLSAKDIGSIAAYAAIAGIGLSSIWFLLMLKFAGTMIHISYILSGIVMLAAAAYFGYIKSYIACVIWAIVGVLVLVSYWFIRSKIPFAKVMLKTVCKIMIRYSGTILAGFIGLVVSAVFNVAWFLALLGGYQWTVDNNLSTGVQIALGIIMLFFLYWFNEVVRNVVHVTVAGTFATYYFVAIQQPGNEIATVPGQIVTAKSAGRALTTSFGPICFGSLLIAIIETLRALARQAQNEAAQDGNIFLCLVFMCINCILTCFEDILLYFNKYAFTQVAIYGKGYCDAGKDTWALFQRVGIEAIINDNLIGSVLSIGSLCIGVIGAAIGFAYVKLSTTIAQDAGTYAGVCVVAALIGMWMFLILAEVINSGVAATFVCLAEEPHTLQRQQPALFEKIRATWPELTFNGYY
ncbi:plasma-membrane choline transporter-domain-containing protein [Zopfochytrium polystomum]|nr:plasma-membrane choline transporter-domain-containing protein [Zopfochytrium polystomum]